MKIDETDMEFIYCFRRSFHSSFYAPEQLLDKHHLVLMDQIINASLEVIDIIELDGNQG